MAAWRTTRGVIAWDIVAYAILAMITAVVLILIFTGTAQRSQQTATQCRGLLDFGEFTGTCKPPPCGRGETEVSAFGSGCERGEVCCIVEQQEGTS